MRTVYGDEHSSSRCHSGAGSFFLNDVSASSKCMSLVLRFRNWQWLSRPSTIILGFLRTRCVRKECASSDPVVCCLACNVIIHAERFACGVTADNFLWTALHATLPTAKCRLRCCTPPPLVLPAPYMTLRSVASSSPLESCVCLRACTHPCASFPAKWQLQAFIHDCCWCDH
jgi:hypothetical protein